MTCKSGPGVTHHLGCSCHEAGWAEKLRERDERIKHLDAACVQQIQAGDTLSAQLRERDEEIARLKDGLKHEARRRESLIEAIGEGGRAITEVNAAMKTQLARAKEVIELACTVYDSHAGLISHGVLRAKMRETLAELKGNDGK